MSFYLKKHYLIFISIFAINICGFAILIKLATKLHLKQQQITTKTKYINIAVFDPVAEFFLHELCNDVKNIDIYNVNEYLLFKNDLSFFKKNKIITSDAIIAFDPEFKIKNFFNIEEKKFYNIYTNIFQQNQADKISNSDDILKSGEISSIKNLRSLLMYLTNIMKEMDPKNKQKYEQNFFNLNKKILDVFSQSSSILYPFNSSATQILTIGMDGSVFLKSIDFVGVIDVDVRSGKDLNKKMQNLKNLINSGGVSCVINLSDFKTPDIERLTKVRGIKYMSFSIYEHFNLENYIIFAKTIKKCFE
jgi:hypothetical protein